MSFSDAATDLQHLSVNALLPFSQLFSATVPVALIPAETDFPANNNHEALPIVAVTESAQVNDGTASLSAPAQSLPVTESFYL